MEGACAIVSGMARIKICGVTRLEDAEAAAHHGAWAVGLNHWQQSPRRCPPEMAATIGAALKRRCEVVGVFVNAGLGEIERAVEDEGLSAVQLHGDEGPAFCREVARRTGCKVIKALRVRSAADVRAAEAYRTDYHLLDTHRPGKPGGTGESFDWELVAGRRSQIPLVLAGGLTPANVGEAIAVAHPWGIDVATGVEAEPGRKDPALLEAFFENARAATRAGSAVA
jgi:phosphoribosylanthranilate isomerase